MATHLAVSIVAADPDEALNKAYTLPPEVTMVEYRLDMMAWVDVSHLSTETPIPAIFTCRPPHEGGHFQGSEKDRLEILKDALKTGHWVDLEWDTLATLGPSLTPEAQIIGSHHHFQAMLREWSTWEQKLRSRGAHVAKLVGMAQSEEDAYEPLSWLSQAHGPSIGIAMGAAGVATRLLAPRFPKAFLTFASLDQTTAPGQVSIHEWVQRFGFTQTAEADPLLALLTPEPIPWDRVAVLREEARARFPDRRPWVLPIPTRQVTFGLLRALHLARVEQVRFLPGVALALGVERLGLSPNTYVTLPIAPQQK